MAAAGRIRNRGCIPYLDHEGVFVKPIVLVECKKDSCYDSASSPFQRLFMHQTLASARRNANFKRFENLIPKDALDLVLATTFNESSELFAEKEDVYLQPETLGVLTWRRLRNTRDLTPNREQRPFNLTRTEADAPKGAGDHTKGRGKRRAAIPFRYNFAHKVLIGGITEKKHPSSIKLMNSSHHSPQTNAGYSRQPSDGNFYQY
ncbi:protein CFAP276 isoform X1 [Euwallacea fornicatus]|uniref:protein CFAP276 isoform X1 n=1 Tax=Euwallacea fornicatus TaxID=995702 RepID=UPI00338F6555